MLFTPTKKRVVSTLKNQTFFKVNNYFLTIIYRTKKLIYFAHDVIIICATLSGDNFTNGNGGSKKVETHTCSRQIGS